MDCRYYEDTGFARCAAVEGSVTPTVHERELFCHADPERCPTLRARRALGSPLAEARYWALWLSPKREGTDEAGASAAP